MLVEFIFISVFYFLLGFIVGYIAFYRKEDKYRLIEQAKENIAQKMTKNKDFKAGVVVSLTKEQIEEKEREDKGGLESMRETLSTFFPNKK